MFPCPNFAKCLKTFETKVKQSNHYKNCLIDRICDRCVSKPVFKSESGFRYHAKMHKGPTCPTVVRYGVGDTVHQPTPDPPQPSIDCLLPRESLLAESGDGERFVTDIVEEVEERETEQSTYIKQQLANLEKMQDAQFVASTQLTTYYRKKEEELQQEKEVVEEKKKELDASLQRLQERAEDEQWDVKLIVGDSVVDGVEHVTVRWHDSVLPKDQVTPTAPDAVAAYEKKKKKKEEKNKANKRKK